MIKKPVTQERTKVLYAMSKKEGLFLAEEIRKAYIPINNKVNKQQKKYKRIFSSFCLVGGSSLTMTCRSYGDAIILKL